MIRKWLAELMEHYSFIEKIDRKGNIYFVWYQKNGQPAYKKIPMRLTRPQLKKFLQKLRKEADKHERRKLVFETVEPKS